MTRAKSVRGIQSFNQSVNRGRVAQYPEARSRTFSWILGHGYWDTHLTRVLCVSQYSPSPFIPILTLLGGLANQFDDFARGPCARYSGVLVRFQVPGGNKDQNRARDENEQAEQHGDSQ